MRFPLRLLLGGALTGATVTLAALDPDRPAREVGALYADYCAGCHGPTMAGGKGGSLVDNQWRHGGDPETLFRSIQRGYPMSGMPGFAATVTAAETRALIAFMLETATRRVDPPRAEEDPLPVAVQTSEEHGFRFEPVVDGLDVPWSFAFLPDGRMLVTERVGRLRIVENGRLLPEPVADLPAVVVKDEAGLMSVVADPHFAENDWIYLSFSDPGEGDTAMTRIVRGRLHDGRLVEKTDIFAPARETYPQGYVLFGGRLVFHDDHLFFSVGERGMEESATGQAQQLDSPHGKIHRVHRDGSIPADNPFVNTPGAWPSVWAYGVRNPHGLAIDPRNGALWETEHGPRGGDELNVIERGRNYGWPLATFGMNYDGTPISDKTGGPGLEPPVINWTPSIAVDAIEFYRGDRFPRWKHQLFVGSLAQQKFLRLAIEGNRVVHREEVFSGLGRVRDIKTGPDGLLYVALELIGKPGRIVRLVPAE